MISSSGSSGYAAVGTAVVGGAVLVLWPFLGPVAREGVAIAALVALPIQIVSFALLVRLRARPHGFLAAWLGGTLLRMVAIGVVAFLVLRSGTDGALAMLLALASFFFALLLLEPLYFKRAGHKALGKV